MRRRSCWFQPGFSLLDITPNRIVDFFVCSRHFVVFRGGGGAVMLLIMWKM